LATVTLIDQQAYKSDLLGERTPQRGPAGYIGVQPALLNRASRDHEPSNEGAEVTLIIQRHPNTPFKQAIAQQTSRKKVNSPAGADLADADSLQQDV
jgi:hypothetical protein